jgi:hypothetical protein
MAFCQSTPMRLYQFRLNKTSIWKHDFVFCILYKNTAKSQHFFKILNLRKVPYTSFNKNNISEILHQFSFIRIRPSLLAGRCQAEQAISDLLRLSPALSRQLIRQDACLAKLHYTCMRVLYWIRSQTNFRSGRFFSSLFIALLSTFLTSKSKF